MSRTTTQEQDTFFQKNAERSKDDVNDMAQGDNIWYLLVPTTPLCINELPINRHFYPLSKPDIDQMRGSKNDPTNEMLP